MKTMITALRKREEDEKMAPQAKVICDVLVNTVGVNKPLERQALIKALDGKLETRQDIGRIVSFYQNRLVEAGLIAIEKITETAEKPAKEKKAPAKAG